MPNAVRSGFSLWLLFSDSYMSHLPESYRLEYSEDTIRRVVRELGASISTWVQEVYSKTGRDVVAAPILRGGVFFFCDLVRAIDHSVEIAPIRSWGYVTGENAVQREEVSVSLEELSPAGRSILLIDDICDSGKSLDAISRRMLEEGAEEVRSAVLIRRDTKQNIFSPDWVGFNFPGEEWFVGYGMDDRERYRNLSSVYVILQDQK